MKHRNVVANFFFKTDQGRTLVALFKRSSHPNVRSYQGKLAPISGSIDENDANPLQAATREIKEETQLTADKDIKLEFVGKPYSFVDDQAQRSWTVHPFGWDLVVGEDKIHIDWEHSGWEWFHPDQLLQGYLKNDCVPNLDKSLMRVYFGPYGMFPGNPPLVSRDTTSGQEFLSTIERLKSDKDSGARDLATEALKGLESILKSLFIERSPDNGNLVWWSSLRIAAYHLIYSARPSMNAAIRAAILHAFRNVILRTNTEPQFSDLVEDFHTSIAERSEATAKLPMAFSKYVAATPAGSSVIRKVNVITLSSSSTIRSSLLNLLKSLSAVRLHVAVLESRPMCEGAALAASLVEFVKGSDAEARLSVTVAPDSHAAYLVQDRTMNDCESQNFVLLGADCITPSGHVSNKMGSAILAVLAKTLAPSIKVVVLSDSDKITLPSDLAAYESGKQDPERELKEHYAERNDAVEVTRTWSHTMKRQDVEETLTADSEMGNVQIENCYFELVNYKWIDAYIFEDGPKKREEILAMSVELGRREGQVFGNLYMD